MSSVILITGTSKGIGEYLANYYLTKGHIVVGCSRRKPDITNTNYTHFIIAYRAGGYNLFPETKRILKALSENGIKVDTSMSRGYYFKSDFSSIDYRKLPDKPNWYIDPNGDFSKDAPTGIYEVPIAGKPKSIFEIPTKFKINYFEVEPSKY